MAKKKFGCCVQSMGVVLMGMNICFFLAGILLFGVSVWVSVELSDWGIYLPIGLAVLGALLCIISILGFCAAFRKSKCMLFTFFIILLVLVVAQAALIVAVLVEQDDLKSYLQKRWNKMDCDKRQDIEKHTHCCGWSKDDDSQQGDSSSDSGGGRLHPPPHDEATDSNAPCTCGYHPSTFKLHMDRMEDLQKEKNAPWYTQIPRILDLIDEEEKEEEEEEENIFSSITFISSATNITTCSKKIEHEVRNHLLQIGIVGAILVVCQLVGLVFSCCMCQEIREVPDEAESMALLSDARRHRHEDRHHRHSDRHDYSRHESNYGRSHQNSYTGATGSARISAREDEYRF